MRAVSDPTVAVIITNYNYGHFLPCCIDSVLQQTQAASEIIVVDDGSSDGSSAILDQHRDQLTIIEKSNGGQASAFNTGFAQASADIILFLDADDVLKPEAIEAIVSHWQDDLSVLSFGLEIIDHQGWHQGLYPETLLAMSGDNRTRLLSCGWFTFAPTSGNAFSRAAIAEIFPIPEQRWRISADMYLLSAAALFGRMAVLNCVLGGYREHGSNNYRVDGGSEVWSHGRGMRDIADTMEALAALNIPGLTKPQAALIRLRSLICSLELRLRRLHFAGEPADLPSHARRLLVKIVQSGGSLSDRFSALLAVLPFAVTGWRLRRLRQWLENRNERPGYIRAWLRLIGYQNLERKLGLLQQSRWPELLEEDVAHAIGKPGPARNILSEGWIGDLRDGWQLSQDSVAKLRFRVNPSPRPMRIDLGIEIPATFGDRLLLIYVDFNGERLWAEEVCNQATVVLTPPHRIFDPNHVNEITIHAAYVQQTVWQKIVEVQPHFILTWIKVADAERQWSAPFLDNHKILSFSEFVTANSNNDCWLTDGEGVARLTRSHASLHFTRSGSARPSVLNLTLAPDCPSGWLKITRYDHELFTGEAIGGTMLHLPLPPAEESLVNERLDFNFFVANPEQQQWLSLSHVSLRPQGDAVRQGLPCDYIWQEYPHLHAGQHIVFDAVESAIGFLGQGWQIEDGQHVWIRGHEASSIFTLDRGCEHPVLHVELEPTLVSGLTYEYAVGVSVAGKLIQTTVLSRPEILEIALATEPIEPGRPLIVTFHVAIKPEDNAFIGEQESWQEYINIRLRSFRLTGETKNLQPSASMALKQNRTVPRLPALMSRIDNLQAGKVSAFAEPLVLGDYRAQLATILWHYSEPALLSFCKNEDYFRTMMRLAADTRDLPLTQVEADIVAAIESLSSGFKNQADNNGPRLRSLLCAILLLPAFRCSELLDIDNLPAPLLLYDDVVANYLAKQPGRIDSNLQAEALLDSMTQVYQSITAILLRGPAHRCHYRIAERILPQMYPQQTLFTARNLLDYAKAQGRATETALLQSGAQLAWLPAPRTLRHRPSTRRLRVGVLARDCKANPEGWLLRGMYKGIDEEEIETILLTLDYSSTSLEVDDCFSQHLNFSDRTVADIVAEIRTLQLDILVLGGFCNGSDKLALVSAHRLAPIHLICTAIAPMSTGYRHTDYVLCHPSCEPEDAQKHYQEQVIWHNGPFQCFDFAEVAALEKGQAPLALRDEFGLPRDRLLMVSGAVMLKIGEGLLECWIRILQQEPKASLVLYPFAASWQILASQRRFLDHLKQRLADAGLAEDAIIILRDLDPVAVRRLLKVSDLYLDSFPYAGATTVVEALASDLPVVCREVKTQRGMQGSAWLRAYGLADYVAEDNEGYEALALTLLRDSRRRAAIRTHLATIHDQDVAPYADVKAFGRSFSKTLLDLAAGKPQRTRPAVSDKNLLEDPDSAAASPAKDSSHLHEVS